MPTMTSKTFREYTYRDPSVRASRYLVINTDYPDRCRLSIIAFDMVRTAHLTRELALDLGTKLIAWCGSASSWAEEVFNTGAGESGNAPAKVVRLVELNVEDGEATIGIGSDGEGLAFTLPEAEDWSTDLGRRLIAFGWAAA